MKEASKFWPGGARRSADPVMTLFKCEDWITRNMASGGLLGCLNNKIPCEGDFPSNWKRGVSPVAPNY